MPISLSRSAALITFARGLAAHARLMTVAQVAAHPSVSDLSQPAKRAYEVLSSEPTVFESLIWYQGKPSLWRLTLDERKRMGLHYRAVGVTSRVPHWLAMGDIWSHLVFSGLRPTKWYTEGKTIGGFDLFFVVNGKHYLAEVQLSELTAKEWHMKWSRRMAWWKEKRWTEKAWGEEFTYDVPTVLLITPQPLRSVKTASGVVHVASLSELTRFVRK